MPDVQPAPERRSPPFSIRFTEEEFERLDRDRQGMRRGTYIKAKLFDGVPLKRAGAVEDRAALAKALALLGQSRYASNLNQIAHAANLGSLVFTEVEQAELQASLAHIAEIRELLLKATGIRKDA